MLKEERVKALIYQIAKALEYLHSFGVVHRDLKLENIMMNDNTQSAIPKLCDFGLARIVGPNETATEPFGTLGYVAPEVLKKEPYSFSADLWSLGCMIHALLTGTLPFDSETSAETIKMTLEDPLLFELPQLKQASQALRDLIMSLLIKDPNQRISLENTLKHKWFDSARSKESCA